MAQFDYTCPHCGTFHEKTYGLRACRNGDCLEPFLREAGDLEQKYILFFGMPNSGKHSAMVVLTAELRKRFSFQPLAPSNLEEIIANFHSGKLVKKRRSAATAPYSFTMRVQTADSGNKFLLTLVSIPWGYKASSRIFPRPSAYVLCWDMQTEIVNRRFPKALDDLRWDLSKPMTEQKTSKFMEDQLKSFNDFVENIYGSPLPEETYKDDLKNRFVNLCREVEDFHYHTTTENTSTDNKPPILLLYNKHDTIPNEEWRLSPKDDNSQKNKKLLSIEIQAFKSRDYFPILQETSAIFTSTLNSKFLEGCFYAQIRFSPYGSDVPRMGVPRFMLTHRNITRAIMLYLRLQLYALQYKNPNLLSIDRGKLITVIEKYTSDDPYGLPEAYRTVLKTIAGTLLNALGAGTYSRPDFERLFDAYRRAERHYQLICYQIDRIPTHRKPAPQNADLLCQWLLHVSGILAISPKKVQPDPTTIGSEPIFLQSPAYRSKPAASGQEDTQKKQAAARLYLFENPYDEDLARLTAGDKPENIDQNRKNT